jgi:hypothetical protein
MLKERDMDTIVMVITVLLALLALAGFASAFGTDSRESLGDTRVR